MMLPGNAHHLLIASAMRLSKAERLLFHQKLWRNTVQQKIGEGKWARASIHEGQTPRPSSAVTS